jgi:hypothetical protein
MTTIYRRTAALAVLALAAAAVLATNAASAPGPAAFAIAMLAPVGAALVLSAPGFPWPLAAGALYAALAGLRTFVAPAGEPTFAEQLSTAAIIALLVAIVQRAWSWIRSTPKRR